MTAHRMHPARGSLTLPLPAGMMCHGMPLTTTLAGESAE